jgi:purine nucleosidase
VTASAPDRAAPRKIILDCDPGIDDALAIAFACGHPGLELLGLTTVGGNVDLAKTTANALAVRDFAGCPGVPVVAGSPAPLLRSVLDARHVHGESGLGAASLPAARSGARDGHAVDYLVRTIGAAAGEITLVATGPLTNIALAVRREPRLVTQVRDFVIMGGSAGRGNVTPAAEFNIAADPEAAAIVFGAGWTVTMVGLDVTYLARATAAVQERMRGLGRLGAGLLLPALSGYRHETAAALGRAPGAADGPAVHDVCALALVAAPGLFGCLPARVEVETAGRWTTGMTVTDFTAPEDERNALVAMSMDVPGFWDLVLDAYARTAAARSPARSPA